MTTEYVIILLATGLAVGFASGLLGLGGAFIMTPVQVAVFMGMGLPTDMAVKLAFGTTLLVILPTTASGAWRHHKKGAVWWKAAFVMGACGLLGGVGGATLSTSYLDGSALKIAFGSVALLAAAWMLVARLPAIEEQPRGYPLLWVALSLPVGVVTGMLGVGGGVLTIPMLTLALKFQIHKAIATSLAIIVFTSLGGILGYIVNGWNVPGLPPYSIGYINLLVWLLLAIPSTAMAQFGAVIAHRLSARYIKYIFIAIMVYMGLRMLGVFEWLGWPL